MSKTLIPEFMITINDDQHCFHQHDTEEQNAK